MVNHKLRRQIHILSQFKPKFWIRVLAGWFLRETGKIFRLVSSFWWLPTVLGFSLLVDTHSAFTNINLLCLCVLSSCKDTKPQALGATFAHNLCHRLHSKSLQSCPTLCDPRDASPPGSPIPGILQARTLEWVAISFSNAWKWKVKVQALSRVRLFATPWTAAYQAPPSMGFSRQEHWSGVPLPSPALCITVINTWNSKALQDWLVWVEGQSVVCWLVS